MLSLEIYKLAFQGIAKHSSREIEDERRPEELLNRTFLFHKTDIILKFIRDEHLCAIIKPQKTH